MKVIVIMAVYFFIIETCKPKIYNDVECECGKEYSGKRCENVACQDNSCSNHGMLNN